MDVSKAKTDIHCKKLLDSSIKVSSTFHAIKMSNLAIVLILTSINTSSTLYTLKRSQKAATGQNKLAQMVIQDNRVVI